MSYKDDSSECSYPTLYTNIVRYAVNIDKRGYHQQLYISGWRKPIRRQNIDFLKSTGTVNIHIVPGVIIILFMITTAAIDVLLLNFSTKDTLVIECSWADLRNVSKYYSERRGL